MQQGGRHGKDSAIEAAGRTRAASCAGFADSRAPSAMLVSQGQALFLPDATLGIEMNPAPFIQLGLQRGQALLVQAAAALDRHCVARSEERGRARVIETQLLSAYCPSQQVRIVPHRPRKNERRDTGVI